MSDSSYESMMNSAREECERLRAALKPFADFAEIHGPEFRDACPMRLAFTGQPNQPPTLGDCRRAAEVLK